MKYRTDGTPFYPIRTIGMILMIGYCSENRIARRRVPVRRNILLRIDSAQIQNGLRFNSKLQCRFDQKSEKKPILQSEKNI